MAFSVNPRFSTIFLPIQRRRSFKCRLIFVSLYTISPGELDLRNMFCICGAMTTRALNGSTLSPQKYTPRYCFKLILLINYIYCIFIAWRLQFLSYILPYLI